MAAVLRQPRAGDVERLGIRRRSELPPGMNRNSGIEAHLDEPAAGQAIHANPCLGEPPHAVPPPVSLMWPVWLVWPTTFGPVDEQRDELGILSCRLLVGRPDHVITPGLAYLLRQPANLFASGGIRRKCPHRVVHEQGAQFLELAPQRDARRGRLGGKVVEEQDPHVTYVAYTVCLHDTAGRRVSQM